MSDEEFDPEVQRDIELRESSQYDSSRSRTKAHAEFSPAEITAHWSCRNKACRAPVGVTEATTHAFEIHNRRLRSLGEQPLNTAEIMICPECAKLREKRVADRNRERTDKLALVIQAMKQSPNPREEHERIDQLEKLGHPDIKGLLDALAAKLEKSGKRAGERKL